MGNFKIYVIEDDKILARRMSYELELNPDFEVEVFYDGESFLKQLNIGSPDAISLDYLLPDMTGSEILHKIKEFNANIPVLIVSGQKDVLTAITLLKEGAYDYLVKTDDMIKKLRNLMSNIREKVMLERKVDVLEKEVGKKYRFNNLIKGKSLPILEVFALMEKAVRSNITISIAGETGTGKELVAKSIHYNSSRKKQAFIAINVSAIPKDLIESELFGYDKGAFTGANQNKSGKFEEAHKGTLFLDEIGDMEIHMQTKLLRVLQDGEYSRLGSNKPQKVDCRIIIATHRNLAQEVKKGHFREDLYYRLLGLPIFLPPLRNRGTDVTLLAQHFIKHFATENDLPVKELSIGANQKLNEYHFPGNVRELQAIIELAMVLSNNNSIEAEDINFNSVDGMHDLFLKELSLKEYDLQIVKIFLEKYHNDIPTVADRLDIGKSTIYRILAEEKKTPKVKD
ncbi:MAG: sigma-54 dependent transcriptional regulator [Bacteroidales bacterium]|jgi:two-component system response regulator AtoC|nr:sigma-54 dependent transcriptional regulator [Bacteroidales bacterium]